MKNSELKELLKDKGLKQQYDKADVQVFDILKDSIDTAIKNAEKVNKNALDTSEKAKKNPCYFDAYTDFHELLIDMKMFIDKKHSIRNLTQDERKIAINNMLQMIREKL